MTVETNREGSERQDSLWRQADFLKLWGAESISLFGSQITALALPLTAIIFLHASAWQMGLLRASGEAPFLLLSLLAGVWIDRVRRRPILIGADIGRAILLLSLPIAAWWDAVTMPHLYLVALGVGVFTVFFEIAHYAYVPAMIARTQLVDANSKIQTSYSVAESGGPGIAGALIQAISAPFAILADVVSFVLSALLLGTITTPERVPPKQTGTIRIREAIQEGLRALLTPPLLRIIILVSVIPNIFVSGLMALYVLYATQELYLNPASLGLIFVMGGVAAVSGASMAQRVAQRWGVGRAIVGGWIVSGLAYLLIPLADGSTTIVVLIGAQVIAGSAEAIANIHQWTFRQAITPDFLLGRVTASHRFMVYGASAIGAVLGGILGEVLGLRLAISVCAVCALIGPLVALYSPLRHLREQPSAPTV